MERNGTSDPPVGAVLALAQERLDLESARRQDVVFDVDAFARRTGGALALVELHCGTQVANEAIEQIRAAWEIERGFHV